MGAYRLLEKERKNIIEKLICLGFFFKMLRKDIDWIKRRNIQDTDLVLDVGCGYFSHIRANIACEKYIFDPAERPNKTHIKIDRPLIVADAMNLPVEDKSFDYCLCKHLLEHVDRPEVLLKELERVARKGYIETPSLIYEKIHSHPFHRWVVSKEGSKLVVRAKTVKILDEDLRGWFEYTKKAFPELEYMMLDNWELLGLITQFEWDGNIEHEIVNAQAAVDLFNNEAAQVKPFPVDDQQLLKPFYNLPRPEKIKSLVGKLLRRNSSKKVDLFSLLRCSLCKGHLEKKDKVSADLICPNCKVGFPVRGLIYFMLPEYSYKI
ncbi:MAG: methyltransferase domain-containing protein [Candidatus Omnitrophota bacterium]